MAAEAAVRAARFLIANGCIDRADDMLIYDPMIAMAERRMDHAGFGDGLQRQFRKAWWDR